jgi:hypothetical protein
MTLFFVGFILQCGCEGPKVVSYLYILFTYMGKPHGETFVGLAYQGKDNIVIRFMIVYSSLRDFGP